MKNSVQRVLAAAGLLCVVMLTGAPLSQAAQAVALATANGSQDTTRTIGVGPSTTDGRLDGRPGFVFVGRPGTVVRDQVGLVNYTDNPVSVSLYSTDAFTSTTGGFDVLPGTDKPQELGKWIGLTPQVVKIPARTTSPIVEPGFVKVPFTIRVPDSAKPGDFAAGIVVSLRTKEISSAPTVVVDRRVGARVSLRVLGAASSFVPNAALTQLSASYKSSVNPLEPGSVRVSYAFANEGNVTLSARQRLSIDGLVGGAKTVTLENVGPVLPGDKVVIETSVPGIWPEGRVTVEVIADPFVGTDPDAEPDLPEITARTAVPAVPAVGLVALVALVAIVAGTTLVIRRGRKPAVAVDETPELVDA
jgi:hypothetical protein